MDKHCPIAIAKFVADVFDKSRAFDFNTGLDPD
jgi:hypothetical protein